MRAILSLIVALVAAGTSLPAAASDDIAPPPVAAPSGTPECAAGRCEVKLTASQLLGHVERLVSAKKFDEARPLIEALRQAPGYDFQTRFLSAYVAQQTGDLRGAAEQYKAILANDPAQTRVRLELASTMFQLGERQAADRQFRMAEQSGDLTPDVARTIRTVRDVIRQQRAWRFDFSFGLAPDTNINNATSVDTIIARFGDVEIPLELNEEAKAKSGTGQTATVSAGLRLPMARQMSMLVDVDTAGTNYAGGDYDDYSAQLAVGPELRLGQIASVSLQAIGAQRWFGGDLLTRQGGVRVGAQTQAGPRARLGLQLDMRRTDARFDDAFSGWQGGLYATYERGISRTLVASGGLFARRDWLGDRAWSNRELGGTLGLGGELPLGINFGVSGTVSRALFDAPIQFFSAEPRRDWRLVGRATLGYRKLRFLGFSPQVSYAYTRVATPVSIYDNKRSRFTFALARYF
jgi:outer membrane protein